MSHKWAYNCLTVMAITVSAFAPYNAAAAQRSATASVALSACATAETPVSSSIDRLQKIGWTEKSISSIPLQHRKIAHDGLLAATVDGLSADRDIEAALGSVDLLLFSLIRSVHAGDGRMFSINDPAKATLFVMAKPYSTEDDPEGLRCFFAGPMDAETERMLRNLKSLSPQSVSRSDVIGTERVHSVLRHTTTSPETATIVLDTVFGRYTSDVIPALHRAPHAEIGISLLRYNSQ